LLLACACDAAGYFPPPDSEGGWRTLTGAKEMREKTGVDLDRWEQACTVFNRNSPNGGLV
jgi:hypothetical protein